MADNKAATAAAQTQSDKPKKNDGKKKVSFFDKVKNFFKGIGKYFKDTKSELKKVQWPTAKQTVNNVIIVIICVIVVGVCIWIFDAVAGGIVDACCICSARLKGRASWLIMQSGMSPTPIPVMKTPLRPALRNSSTDGAWRI